MGIQKIKTDEFLALAKEHPVLDVRSPGEYSHAHIPGAYNLPLFSDEERKIVGTLYKQEGREQAIKAGLDYFGVKMRKMVEEVEGIFKNHLPSAPANCVLVHCWRGGMRSAGVAWLLDLYGFKVYTLAGGYKAFRNWVLALFERPYPFQVVGGYTGSGKTKVLKSLADQGKYVLDLEGIANHKGSAFGGLGEDKQPSPEQFENILGLALHNLASASGGEQIWVEDESRRIGDINLPKTIWENMRRSPVCFLEIPFEERLNYITEEYGQFKKEQLINSILRIQKRLGGLNTKNAVGFLLEDNYKACFRILLKYYDKYYERDLREHCDHPRTIFKISCSAVDAPANLRKLIDLKHLPDGVANTGN